MTDQLIAKKIWFVYDGECPLCKTAALALKIKQEYGQLTLLNARGSGVFISRLLMSICLSCISK